MDTITLKWTACCVIIYIRTIRSHVRRNMSKFLPRDAIYSAARTMLSQRACQSVHFSRCGIVSKRLNILSTFVLPPDRPISLAFCDPSRVPKFQRDHPKQKPLNIQGVRKIRNFRPVHRCISETMIARPGGIATISDYYKSYVSQKASSCSFAFKSQ